MRFSRITNGYVGLWLISIAFLSVFASNQSSAEPSHGLSAFGDLKYQADFAHFEYVNPDAPKGGRLSMIGTAGLITFDNFNGFILKGNAAQGLEYLFDSLMTPAQDEDDAMYGLVAHSADVAPDRSSVTFYLRPEARFADGSALTSADVVASFEMIKQHGHPFMAMPLRDVVSVEAVDAYTVRYTFQGDLTRDLPLLVAALPILSKAYYERHDFTQTTLEPPLGSGPYKISQTTARAALCFMNCATTIGPKTCRSIAGALILDELKYEYFRDRTTEFEALKAGTYDLREEFTSRTWATEYDIPQVRDGRLQLITLPDYRPSGAQGFFINTRKDRFSDPRVREALALAFDFEWTNRNLFHGLYVRTASFFENSYHESRRAHLLNKNLHCWKTGAPRCRHRCLAKPSCHLYQTAPGRIASFCAGLQNC